MTKRSLSTLILVGMLGAGCSSASSEAAATASTPPPSEPDLVIDVDAASFAREVIASSRPVVVEFGANWCKHCRSQTANLVELAGRYPGRVRLVKIDVDAAPELAQRYGIETLPTTLVFASGDRLGQLRGLRSSVELAPLMKELAEARTSAARARITAIDGGAVGGSCAVGSGGENSAGTAMCEAPAAAPCENC